MDPILTMQLQPLGDRALLAYLASEAEAVRFAASVRAANFPWLEDVVPAYASVGVFFDLDRVRGEEVSLSLTKLKVTSQKGPSSRLRIIPCCYEMQLDLQRVAEHLALSGDDVIARHTAQEFTVYAIGFCPGFPYLGYLPKELEGVPRLPSPRLRVEPGSVGLTARQTGVYPLARPGGWNLIGRTPLVLVDVEDGYFPLEVGDRVRFRRVDETEFRRLEGERL